jgi:nickel-dependent lactate racemase
MKLPYGKKYMDFAVPPGRLSAVLTNSTPLQHRDARLLAKESLDSLPAARRIEKIAAGRRRILLAVPDATRKAHLSRILPEIIRRLPESCRSVDIIVATGLHKAPTRRQLAALLGERILKAHNVMSHDQKSLVRAGSTKKGIPIVLNANLKKYDLIMSVGVIEPHLYAGYSGGAKTVAIGLAGRKTIDATHNVRFLDDPLTAIGSAENNPFQDVLWEIAETARVNFVVNVVNDADGRSLKIFSGGARMAFREGVSFARMVFEVEAARRCDIAVCGIGFPKDVNLYQASRAINYVVNVDRPVVRRGGFVLIVAELSDGAGDGVSERLFLERLKTMASPKEFVNEIARHGCVAGEHRAYMVAKALTDYRIAFVTTARGAFTRHLPFPFFKDIGDAVKHVDSIIGGGSSICVIPRALSTIARLL